MQHLIQKRTLLIQNYIPFVAKQNNSKNDNWDLTLFQTLKNKTDLNVQEET